MRQEACKFQSVEIRSTQRLAISVEPNCTLREMTNLVKLQKGMYQAGAKADVLSPEILKHCRGRHFHKCGRQHEECHNGETI